jgi:hypothetical protein
MSTGIRLYSQLLIEQKTRPRADRRNFARLFPFKFKLHLPHQHPPPNVALDLSGGNNFPPILGGVPVFCGCFARRPLLRCTPSWFGFSTPTLEPERHASVKYVAFSSEVCSHPRSSLTVFVAVATVGPGGCYLVNDVALSSEVCFHPRSPLAVFVVVCCGFWGLLPRQHQLSTLSFEHKVRSIYPKE